VDGNELTTAKYADDVEGEDGEEGSATCDILGRKRKVNCKSTGSWCHHLFTTLPQTQGWAQDARMSTRTPQSINPKVPTTQRSKKTGTKSTGHRR
jgi:hypothetical protein